MYSMASWDPLFLISLGVFHGFRTVRGLEGTAMSASGTKYRMASRTPVQKEGIKTG